MDLYGLVLMGGKSQRMGEDKSKLAYYENVSQMENVYQLLNNYCAKTFLSINQSRQNELFPYKTLVDLEENRGPISGILSAFHFKNDAAWFVCPIDMPFLTKEVIDYLLKNRNVEKDCTCFLNSEIQAPDPLLAIYEPSMYAQLIQAEEQGHRCPKKSILSANHHMILPLDEKWLFNANMPEQFDYAKNKIKTRMTKTNNIKLLAFGKVKDITGWSEFSIENAQSLNQIRNQLYREFPKLETIKSIQWAVNEEYTNDYSTIVQLGDVIALIPPVSGG